MSKTKISEYSATANSNTDVASINIDEGCAPSGINNAIRAVMSHLKDFQAGTAGDSFNGPVGTTTPAAGAFTTLSSTGNVTLGDASTDTLNVGNGGIVKNASGNVGIGTSSPAAKLDVAGNLLFSAASPQIQFNGGGPIIRLPSANTLAFLSDSSTERMRIDSSGNLLVGTTNNDPFVTSSGAAYKPTKVQVASNVNSDVLGLYKNGFTGTYVSFYYNSSTSGSASAGTNTGNITTNGTSTTYATSSDYRLKEDVQPMTGALAKVAALKPVTYKWKSTGEADQGFIAHELAEVEPGCVTGEKDAVDAEGNPIYQGIDTSFLVATLTAAIQELKATVDAQAARIAALEQA